VAAVVHIAAARLYYERIHFPPAAAAGEGKGAEAKASRAEKALGDRGARLLGEPFTG
jgi:hypothetical protein